MSSTTRFPNGVTNVGEDSMFANMGQMSPVGYHTFMDDFDFYNPDNWTESKGGGTTIQAIGTNNGWVQFDMSGGGWYGNIYVPPSFVPGQKPLFFETKLRCGSNFEILAGLKSQYSENMRFVKQDGSTQFTFSNRYDGGAMPVSTDLPGAVVDPSGSDITLGFVVEPTGSINLFVNRQFVAVANGPANMELAQGPYFYFTSYSSAPASAAIDYILISKERV